jgi:hypothetical protein
MRTYDVHVGDGGRRVHNFRAHIRAASPSEALLAARRAMPTPAWHGLVSVFQHRRLRRRALVGTFLADGPDDGSAGVREPRRPLPAPPSLEVARQPLVEEGPRA